MARQNVTSHIAQVWNVDVLIYTMEYLLKGLRISFMIFWNSLRAFFKSKGITFHSYCPKGVTNDALYLSFS
jgi:hypothetical protein